VAPGVTTAELNRAAEEVIQAAGAVSAFKGYHPYASPYPFPAATCVSVNEEVVHGIPSKRRLAEGDVVSVDIGVRLHNYHGDAARTFPVGRVAPEVSRLLEVGREAMGSPVEFEFAVNLKQKEFNILQMRPMISWTQAKRLNIDPDDQTRTICYSPRALGHGHITGIYDIIYTKPDAFDSLKTAEIAREIGRLNEQLRKEGKHYMLIGPGRWGSADPNLGIPVAWDDISESKLIIETTLPDFVVDPSYGTHFLHNVISMEIGYLTVRHDIREGRIDWDWLASCEAVEETKYIRHLRMPAALDIRIDGRQGRGAALRA